MTPKTIAHTTVTLHWVKSSYSSGELDSDCVEVAWRKSSYSSNEDGQDCVEFAAALDHIHVRDSKRTDLPYLTLTPTAWSSFLTYATRD
ncbi:DUF397 domain-containing protein [Streptomyces sp. NA04227]|uniref:DUF397 domain-containing protein n=1 Tax=Streptomyces sp. NA04227 TaxID=2742136 RepID=UPI001590C728|nr:DUF397 domain-containing protein [Streptomyces sp. NA04227]QKW08522.1 DUF397 domain-containing protein [Streptomyces sp. NA04227]